MKTLLAVALAVAVGTGMLLAPDANAQAKKKAEAAAAPAQWTDCSKVEPAKRDVCIRNLPTVKGGVPIAGKSAAAPAAAAPAKDAKAAAAPAKDAKKAEPDKKAEPKKVAAPAVNPNSPCAKVDAAKRDACLSKAAASKGPGWAAFNSRQAAAPAPKKK